MKKILLIVLLMTLSQFVWAQVDTEFWFAAPDLEAQHAQQPIRFCISSFELPATVVFEQPANPNYTTKTFNLGANDFYVYDVSSIIQMVETQPYNTVLNTGFHITSTTPVEVYYESNNNNSEIYSLKGVNALGTNFIVPTQFTYDNHYSSTCSRIEVVATQDATTVTFVPSQNIKGGIQAGEHVTVLLNRGQSYAIESSSPNAANHLRNTWITSDKPIAVNTSDDSVYSNGNYDLIGDQIVPVDLIGNEYLALWNNTSKEYLYFFPTEDNTHVYLNGRQNLLVTLNVGEEFQYHLNEPAAYIRSDKPIAVFQLACANNSSEFGGTMLPHISCTGSRKTVYRRNSNSDIVITLVVRTDCVNDFLLNGNANYLKGSDFSVLPTNDYYSYCKKNVSQYVPSDGLMTIENTNEDGYYQLGVFSSSSGTCSYGYFSDYQQYATATFDMDDTYCTGDDIVFNFITENLDEVTFVMPDGTTMTEPPFILNDVQTSQSGTYYLQGELCNGIQILDEINIQINGPATETVNIWGCTQKQWHGIVFDHTVDTIVVVSNPDDCDSIYNVHVEIYEPYTQSLNITGCDDAVWHGFVFDHSVDTVVIINNPNDCDSIYNLHVEIDGPYTQNVSITGCVSTTWNGFVFDHALDTVVIVNNPDDCDSIYNVHVDILQPYTQEVNLEGCFQEVWHGHIFNHTMDTVWTVANPNDCDSIYNVHVEIIPKTMGILGLTQIAVASDLWPGTYNYCISNQTEFEGCNIGWTCSNTNWIIEPFPDDPYWLRLIANTYGTAILTATATCPDGCNAIATIDLNATNLSVDEVASIFVSMYPNPANDNLTIISEQIKQVRIFDCYGQKMIEYHAALENEVTIETACLNNGIYLVEILTSKGQTTKQLLISK